MIYDRMAELLTYPDAKRPLVAVAGEACALAPAPASELLAAFVQDIRALSTEELQERFVATFELNPACSLEVGWHLYGENYERGEFLVKMRQEMRRLGVAESSELPDHITHVLPVLGRFAPDEAAVFAAEYVYPALKKMRPGLEGKENPYGKVLAALDSTLMASYPEIAHYQPGPEAFPIFQEEVAHDW